MRVLGVDTGERRTGVAISDPDEIIAVPLSVLTSTREQVIAEIAELTRREQVKRIVVGLPLSLNGERGPQARIALHIGRQIEAATGLPVVFWDERFSTAEADRLMLEAGLNRRRRDARRDAAAAAVILQDYLDSHRTVETFVAERS